MPPDPIAPTWDAPALRDAALVSAAFTEPRSVPPRFEAVFLDPERAVWAAGDGVVGTDVTWQADAGDPCRGRVWGRELLNTRDGPRVRVWGFDDAYRLHVCRGFRGFRGGLAAVAAAAAEGSGLAVKVEAAAAGRYEDADNQLVQYDETAWEFLRRVAAAVGAELTAYRGTLYIGPGPGAGKEVEIDLDAPEWAGAEVELSTSWCDQPPAFHVPVFGLPFPAGPKLPGANPSERYIRPSGVGVAARKLAAVGAVPHPAGVAATDAQRPKLADALAAAADRRRCSGVLVLPAGGAAFAPGVTVSVTQSGRVLAEHLAVAAVTHRADGADLRVVVAVGEPDGFDEAPPNHRPACHVWPAVAAGTYRPGRGLIDVRPVGWHPDSAPLAARLLGWSAKPGPAAVRVPMTGEPLLIAFEGGRPEAPVVLGGLHDDGAPAADPGAFVAVTPDGQVKIALAAKDLAVALKGINLGGTGDKVSVRASDVFVRASKVEFDKS
jgi:hypothetical protein